MQMKNRDAPMACVFCMIQPYGTSREIWIMDEKARLMLAV